MKYHPYQIRILTYGRETGRGTMPGGQFDWGGYLLNCNGGVQRCSQCGRQSHGECKGRSTLNCETYKSNRYESRS